MLIEKEKYEDVLDMIGAIRSRGKNDVMLVVKKIRCEFEKIRKSKSTNSSQQDVCLSSSYFMLTTDANELNGLLEFTEKIEHLEECCIDLEYVVEKLSNLNSNDSSAPAVLLILLRALLVFTKFFEGKEKL